ncbi:MAG: glycosyltransferase, partial [Pirellulales bacterium]
RYQGIDLLIDSFALALPEMPRASLVIVGGSEQDIRAYRGKVQKLSLEKNIFLPGPRPVEELGVLLAEADVLVSPRISGDNTPMKIYSYLHAGKPLVVTDLPTHTQVLNSSVAFLGGTTPPACGWTPLVSPSGYYGSHFAGQFSEISVCVTPIRK